MKCSISIVVSVLGVTDYLRECIASLCQQERRPDCVILAGETNCPEVVECTAQLEQFGISAIVDVAECWDLASARNRGFSLAETDYVLFCESVDTLDKRCVRAVLGKVEDTAADIILYSGIDSNWKNGKVKKPKGFVNRNILTSPEGGIPTKDIEEELYQCTSASVRGKTFRVSLLKQNDLMFTDGAKEEDPFLVYGALGFAKGIAWIDKQLHNRITGLCGCDQFLLSDAFGMLESLKKWHQLLIGSMLGQSRIQSYQIAALRLLKQKLTVFAWDVDRCSFIDALNESGCLKTYQLVLNDVDYDSEEAVALSQFVRGALRQRRKFLEYKTAAPAVLVTPEQEQDVPPKVSIVIPVYNAMPYLAETMNCILGQTLSEIEVICIDDGSSDDSLEYLLELSRSDSRIAVFSQPNMGQSRARNVGISVATGEAIYFMDSDDLLDSDALATLYAKLNGESLDLVCFDADTLYETQQLAEDFPSFRMAYKRHRWYEGVWQGAELMAQLKTDGAYFQSPCLYLSRLSLVRDNGIAFIEGILHEDNAFTFSCFAYAERATHINRPMFHRRIRQGSTMTSPITFARAFGYFSCFLSTLQVFKKLETRMNQRTQGALLRIVFDLMKSARASYNAMVSEDCGCEYGLCEFLRPFVVAVREPAMKGMQYSEKKAELKASAERVRMLEKEIRNLRGSKSYRVAHVLTSPLRMIRRVIR